MRRLGALLAGLLLAVGVGADTRYIGPSGGVTSLVAGTNITLSPSSGVGAVTVSASGGGSGTVTSVGLADGSTAPFYTITNSPVTGSGTLTFTLATQTDNCVFAGPSSGPAAQPTCRALVVADIPTGTSGATIPLLSTANTWGAVQTLPGQTAGSTVAAGKIGETWNVVCPANGTTTGVSITNTNASPTVITWASIPASATGAANWTCPIYFTSAPTGLSASTVYWIIGSTVSGNTFEIADTAAHALAGTNAQNASGTSGTASMGSLPGASVTAYAGAAMNLGAGYWLCSGVGQYYSTGSASTTTYFAQGLGQTVSLPASIGVAIANFSKFATASENFPTTSNMTLPFGPSIVNISGTTTYYLSDAVASTGYADFNEGGALQCLRVG